MTRHARPLGGYPAPPAAATDLPTVPPGPAPGTLPSDEAAEARGYARAVAVLRDEERYSNWWTSTGVRSVGTVRQHLADYLEAIEQPLPTTEERTSTR